MYDLTYLLGYQTWETKVWFGLCCLMTPGLSYKDIWWETKLHVPLTIFKAKIFTTVYIRDFHDENCMVTSHFHSLLLSLEQYYCYTSTQAKCHHPQNLLNFQYFNSRHLIQRHAICFQYRCTFKSNRCNKNVYEKRLLKICLHIPLKWDAELSNLESECHRKKLLEYREWTHLW